MITLNLSDLIALGAMLVGILGIIATTVISIAKYKAEVNKSYFNKVIDCAYKEWEWKSKEFIDGGLGNKSGKLYPFNFYLYFYHRFFRMLNKKKLKDNDIKEFFKDYQAVHSAMEKYSSKKKEK